MSLTTTFITVFEPQISVLLGSIRRLERSLGPEDDWVEDDRRRLFEWSDAFLRPLGRSTIRKKGTADYVGTINLAPDEVEIILSSKYQRNLLSTRKYREHHSGGRQWSVGSWVHDPEDTEWQHHVYLFETEDVEDESDNSSSAPLDVRENVDTDSDDSFESSRRDEPLSEVHKGRTDVYGHEESSVRNPTEHHRGEQERGDPNGRLPSQLSLTERNL